SLGAQSVPPRCARASHRMASYADNRRGILATLAASAAFTTGDMLSRLATETMPTGQIVAVRGVFAVILVMGFAAATGEMRNYAQGFRPLLVVRGVIESLSVTLFISALSGLPFAVATAIILASSLITTALASMLGLERVGLRRWSALAIGFIGTVFVLR